MSNRDAIIRKIKACLALGKSANEHEAAAAMRQAQKLMQDHGISDFDIETADVLEDVTNAGASTKPARWECWLAQKSADAFCCEVFFTERWSPTPGIWTFVGVGPSAEIARYAFDVLFRQLKRARALHIKTALKRCGPASRTRRADLFCEGWVTAVANKIEAFSGSDGQRKKISGYLESKYKLSGFQGRNRNSGRSLTERDYGDFVAGHHAAKDIELNRGVGTSAPLALAPKGCTTGGEE